MVRSRGNWSPSQPGAAHRAGVRVSLLEVVSGAEPPETAEFARSACVSRAPVDKLARRPASSLPCTRLPARGAAHHRRDRRGGYTELGRAPRSCPSAWRTGPCLRLSSTHPAAAREKGASVFETT